MLARQQRLDNLIAIINYNKYIISASTYDVMDLEPFSSAPGQPRVNREGQAHIVYDA